MTSLFPATLIALASSIVVSSSFIDDYNQRPLFHVTPDQGHWMNDPNGPMHFGNYYHLFYQYNPADAIWGNMSWAHVFSPDLIHWQRLPVALYNDVPYDIGGVFSGSALARKSPGDSASQVYAFYTCVDSADRERQCVAVASDSNVENSTLTSWTKSASNPVIPDVPTSWDNINFRDPTLWQDEGSSEWNLAAAASESGVGIVAAYRTSDADFPAKWQLWGSPLWWSNSSTAAISTWMVECPDFFPATMPSQDYKKDTETLYVLKYSIMESRQEFYEVGYYRTDKTTGGPIFERNMEYINEFATEDQSNALLMDYGPNNNAYAGKTFFDPIRKERVWWSWSPEQDDLGEKRGWQGVQTMPRTVRLDTSAKILRFEPVPGYEALRLKELSPSHGVQKLHDEGAVELLPSSDLQLELEAEFTLPSQCSLNQAIGSEFGLLVRRSVDGSRYTKMGFKVVSTSVGVTGAAVVFVLDTQQSGGTTPARSIEQAVPGQSRDTSFFQHTASNDTTSVRLHVFLDHSMSEIFVQDGAYVATARLYPQEEDTGLAWYSTSQSACVPQLSSWRAFTIGSVWL